MRDFTFGVIFNTVDVLNIFSTNAVFCFGAVFELWQEFMKLHFQVVIETGENLVFVKFLLTNIFNLSVNSRIQFLIIYAFFLCKCMANVFCLERECDILKKAE